MAEFYIKLLFRIIHITAGCLIIGSHLADSIFGKRDEGYGFFFPITGSLLFISGVINLILLRPSKTMGNERKPWLYAIYVKIVIWFLCLPIIDLICSWMGFEFPREPFTILLMIAVILVSSYAKQIRDSIMLNRLKNEWLNP
ncbi:unnamed protein product [Blepharisma stoltei]|uniref:Uncharacterized protein n=1 Tax=Blepharisma stoltei TaxID=1481888 RepID=A0AAU9JWL9_9CILI|nr:unnamed protein product [Blepharisma stoltei]